MRFVVLGTFLAFACVLIPGSGWAQSELESNYFTTSDGVQLHYLEAGSGPPLVFVPGWTMPAWIWEPQLRISLRRIASSHWIRADRAGQIRSPTDSILRAAPETSASFSITWEGTPRSS